MRTPLQRTGVERAQDLVAGRSCLVCPLIGLRRCAEIPVHWGGDYYFFTLESMAESLRGGLSVAFLASGATISAIPTPARLLVRVGLLSSHSRLRQILKCAVGPAMMVMIS